MNATLSRLAYSLQAQFTKETHVPSYLGELFGSTGEERLGGLNSRITPLYCRPITVPYLCSGKFWHLTMSGSAQFLCREVQSGDATWTSGLPYI